jgi:hypothetical protein
MSRGEAERTKQESPVREIRTLGLTWRGPVREVAVIPGPRCFDRPGARFAKSARNRDNKEHATCLFMESPSQKQVVLIQSAINKDWRNFDSS